jgi:predicted DNA-binding transcriptional regulator YafY
MLDESLELFVPQLTQAQLPIAVQAEGVFLTDEMRAQYELFARAEQLRQVVEFTYRDCKGVVTDRRQAEPYGFLVSQGQMFVLARDRRKHAMRTFALEHMSNVRVLPSTFVKPADFDIAEYGRNSPSGLFDGPPFEARIRFSARVAAYAKRTRLGRSARHIEELLTTDVVLTLDVADAGELLRWVLSFGRDAELLAPADLRATLADSAAAIAAIHRAPLQGA